MLKRWIQKILIQSYVTGSIAHSLTEKAQRGRKSINYCFRHFTTSEMTGAMRLVFSSQALFGNSSGENVGDLCELWNSSIFTANWLLSQLKYISRFCFMSGLSRGGDYDSLIRDERSYDNVQTFLVSRCHKILSTTWWLSLTSISITSWSHRIMMLSDFWPVNNC